MADPGGPRSDNSRPLRDALIAPSRRDGRRLDSLLTVRFAANYSLLAFLRSLSLPDARHGLPTDQPTLNCAKLDPLSLLDSLLFHLGSSAHNH
jgi:hypothetical protein